MTSRIQKVNMNFMKWNSLKAFTPVNFQNCSYVIQNCGYVLNVNKSCWKLESCH